MTSNRAKFILKLIRHFSCLIIHTGNVIIIFEVKKYIYIGVWYFIAFSHCTCWFFFYLQVNMATTTNNQMKLFNTIYFIHNLTWYVNCFKANKIQMIGSIYFKRSFEVTLFICVVIFLFIIQILYYYYHNLKKKRKI